MRTVTISIRLPEWVWGRLASIAESRQMKVADLLVVVIGDLIDASTVRPPRGVQPRVWAESDPDGRLKELMDEVAAARESGWRAPRRQRKEVA